jgi:hypothetical protein
VYHGRAICALIPQNVRFPASINEKFVKTVNGKNIILRVFGYLYMPFG